MKLTDAKLRTLAKSGKHFDGAGLYLELTPAGGRYWRLKYRIAGKEKRLALGVYPAVGLKDARELAAQARRSIQAGDDPAEQRKAAKARVAHDSPWSGFVPLWIRTCSRHLATDRLPPSHRWR